MITLPGLIDTHVHLREPGATHKEDFETGTSAAVAGGYTTVLDMPNNPEPTITPGALQRKINLATKRIYSDVGFHFGATINSSQYFQQIKDKVFGLKVYMNHTTGTLLQEDPKILQIIFEKWPKDKVLMVHAEGETLQKAIDLARKNNNKLHVCHVSLASEIRLIQQAKVQGLSISCEVTAHHLFLTKNDAKRLGVFGMMRPPLENPDVLWKAIADRTIDMIASDHAPHTKEEKLGPNPPNGVPGLETTLPLLLTAAYEGKLTIEDIIRLCHTNPAKIFNIPVQKDTFVEIDPTIRYTLYARRLYTKCKWTPFQGKRVKGKVKRVVLRGQTIFKDGEIIGNPRGKVISPL
ncbi:amidohydrolase family protein [Candidatus Daviesbacteria bacterium]|nr:amidohydrolase family protein [Candidatus Daviesbacteria bacterium]